MPAKLRSNRQSQYLHYLFRLSCMCGTVAAILGMQSVGGGSLRGELCFQVKMEGTTPFIKETQPLKLFFKSPVNETLLLWGVIYYSHTHTGGGGGGGGDRIFLERIFLVGPKDPKISALTNFLGSFSGRTRSHTTRLNSCVNTDKTLL